MEIVQSRGVTAAEAMKLTKAVTRSYMRDLKREPLYWPGAFLCCLGLGLLVVLCLMLSLESSERWPGLTWWVIGGSIAFVVGSQIYKGCYTRYIARANGASMSPGTRHVLDDRGYTTRRGEQLFFLPWQSILRVEEIDGWILIATSPVHYWPIIPAASGPEAAAQFTAELQRRWQQAKAASQG